MTVFEELKARLDERCVAFRYDDADNTGRDMSDADFFHNYVNQTKEQFYESMAVCDEELLEQYLEKAEQQAVIDVVLEVL